MASFPSTIFAEVVQFSSLPGSAARAFANASTQRASGNGVEPTLGSEIDTSALSGMQTSLHTSHSAFAFKGTVSPILMFAGVCRVTR